MGEMADFALEHIADEDELAFRHETGECGGPEWCLACMEDAGGRHMLPDYMAQFQRYRLSDPSKDFTKVNIPTNPKVTTLSALSKKEKPMSEDKKKKMAKVLTPEFRVSFPHVFQAHSGFENQEPKFSVVMLFPQGANLEALKNLAKNTAKEKWGDKMPANLKNPFRDGNEKDLDGYKDHIFVTASSKMKPGVVDQSVQEIIDPGAFYAGCYARATVTCYAYDKAGNRGVAFGLQNIQKLREGEPFSGRSNAEDDFDAVAGSDVPDSGNGAAESMFD